MEARSYKLSLAVFALLMIAAPLLYGAVDRLWQSTLLLGFGIALLITPLSAPHPSRLQWLFAGGFLALLVGKELFAGAGFGVPEWRTLLAQNYHLPLPARGNPTPVIALDLILVLLLATVWTLWTRSLSLPAPAALSMILLLSAAALASVSLAMQAADPDLIYGVRLVRGWQKFGPFPNRNHTACVLAMGMTLGAGCAIHFFRNKQWCGLVFSALLTLLVTGALLQSRSRGAVLAGVIGLGALFALSAFRLRSKSMLGAAAGLILLFVAGALFSRADVLSRILTPEESDHLSNIGRVEIWRDTFSMWKDTPLLGQGLGTFRCAYPFYKTIPLENDNVLHPESGWLLWLAELGALPLLLAIGFLVTLLWACWREIQQSRKNFILRIAGLSAFLVLLIHSLYDVPAGRWAAGAFGLAAFAIALPLRHAAPLRGARLLGLIVLGIAGFWLFSFLTGKPTASLGARERLLTLWTSPESISIQEIDKVLAAFPLDVELHQIAAFYKYGEPATRREAWQHFSLINRLLPDAWLLPQQQALLAAPYDPHMAFSYWALAIERAGNRRAEIFMTALEHTRGLPDSDEFWSAFLARHPGLQLVYAQQLPKEEHAAIARRWMQSHGRKKELPPYEIDALHSLLNDSSLADVFRQWRQEHPALEPIHYPQWSRILQRWGHHREAWELYAKRHPVPPSDPPVSQSLEKLTRQYRLNPADWLNTQMLIQALEQAGKRAESDKILLDILPHPNAPEWFRSRAAHAAARAGEYRRAIEILSPPQAD